MAKQSIVKGSTSVLDEIFIQDSSKTDGSGLTGLTSASSGLVCYRARSDDGNAGGTSISLTSTGTLGTWASGWFKEKDATNMPGVYEIGYTNASLATGSRQVTIMFKGAANMVPLLLQIELTGTDNQDAVRGGMTALPNANAAASGGLPTFGTGSGQINPDGTGSVPLALGQTLPSTITANTVGEALQFSDWRGGRAGTAQAGASSTITLDAGASSVANSYVGDLIYLYGGTGGGARGTGQHRTVVAYNTSTKVATVDRAWATNPDSTTLFIILPGTMANVMMWNYASVPSPATAGIPDVNVKNINAVTAGSVTTVNAVIGNAVAPQLDGSGYLKLSSGTGSGQILIASGLVTANATQFSGQTITCSAGTTIGAFVGNATAALSVNASGQAAITSNVKKNQALNSFEFMMTDSTNHAPATGKTVTVTRSIDGGAFGAGTLSGVTELSNGIYYINFGSGDLNGNVITLRATASGCDDTFERVVTQP